jgi:sugar/nucleoside kinase (ribokinase family)
MSEIACLGVLVADLLGRPIDQLPPRGRLGLVERMELHVGGCAANTGIDLAKLGVSTAVLGKVGTDGLGDFMVGALEKSGVDTRGIVRDTTAGTSGSMVLVGADGERTFLHYLGGNAQYHKEDVDWAAIDSAKILHVAGAHIMPALDGPPMADVLREARERGITTSLDTVWDATGQWMATLGPSLPYADYFLPSLAEAQALTEREEPSDVAQALRDAGVGTVGLKLGGEGCLILNAVGELRVPAFKVEAVDGTGSGDAWDAGFLLGVLRGWDIERSARFANAVGACCVEAIGATGGVRSYEETEAFLRARS